MADFLRIRKYYFLNIQYDMNWCAISLLRLRCWDAAAGCWLLGRRNWFRTSDRHTRRS